MTRRKLTGIVGGPRAACQRAVRVNSGTAIVGSYEQVAGELLQYWRLGTDEFILSGYPHVEECRRVVSEVLPLLRSYIRDARA